MLASISKEKGVEHFQIFPKSVNRQKFDEWLTRFREKIGDDKVCLFMDQLQVHTSEASKAAMRERGFRWIYNIAYSPEYNPIELTFSKIKYEFKKLRARKLIGLTQESHEVLVAKAVRAVRK